MQNFKGVGTDFWVIFDGNRRVEETGQCPD
jgi:hypothetical protein